MIDSQPIQIAGSQIALAETWSHIPSNVNETVVHAVVSKPKLSFHQCLELLVRVFL